MFWNSPSLNQAWGYAPILKKLSGLEQIPEINHKYIERIAEKLALRAQQMMRLNSLQQYLVHAPVTLATGESGTMWVQVFAGAVGVPIITARLELRRVTREEEGDKTSWLFYFCKSDFVNNAYIQPAKRYFLGCSRDGVKWFTKPAPSKCELPSVDEYESNFIYWTGKSKDDVVVFSYAADYCFFGLDGVKIADISAFENDNRTWVLNACLVGGALTVFSWDSVYTFIKGTYKRINDRLRVEEESINQSGTECFVRNFTPDNEYTLENLELYALASYDGRVTVTLSNTLLCEINEVDNPPTYVRPPIWWYPGEGTTRDYTRNVSIYADVAYEADVLTYASEEIKRYTYLERFGNKILVDTPEDVTIEYKSKITEDSYTERTWPTWSYSPYEEKGVTNITQTDVFHNDELVSSNSESTYSGWSEWWRYTAGEIPSLGLEIVFGYTFIGSGVIWAGYQLNISVYRHGVSIYELPLKDWDPDALDVKLLRKAHNRKGQAIFTIQVNEDAYILGYANGKVTDISALVGIEYIEDNILNVYNLAPISSGFEETA